MSWAPERTVTGRRRVGLFGGTFDPPHVGHLSVAGDVAEALDLSEVVWMPAAVPPHKVSEEVTAAPVRLAMVQAAASGDPRFRVSTLEVERGGASYTVDTLRKLCAEAPDIDWHLILGVDQYREFSTWKKPEEVRSLATLVVMNREGSSAVEPGSTTSDGLVTVAVTRVDISSTEIRDRVRAGGDISDHVPVAVADIIDSEGLYRK
jgi:nicotinate-nucleotide adenylyltransferase